MVMRARPTTGSRRATRNPPVSLRPIGSASPADRRGQAHAQQRSDHEEEADGVAEEDPAGTDGREGDAADGGPDDPAGVHLRGVERDGAGEVLLADEAGEHGAVGGHEHGVGDAGAERRRGRARNGEGSSSDTTAARATAKAIWAKVTTSSSSLAVDEVGHQPADDAEHEHRSELGEDQLADERRRLGEVVGVGRRARSAASTSRCSRARRR